MKKSNTMFNNKVFSCHRMTSMRPSMATLYAIAREKRQINTPSAVARVMGVTQQRLKNWEIRGISKDGALLAQALFGVDSNQLLSSDGSIQESQSSEYKSAKDRPSAPPKVTDITHRHIDPTWPFKDLTKVQWNSLTDDQKAMVEKVGLSYLRTGDPPGKQLTPAPTAAAG